MSEKDIYVRTKTWLKANYPLPFRCRVQLVADGKIPGCLGEFRWMGDRGLIRIRRSSGNSLKAETLIEEHAHALRHALPMYVDYDGEPHDAVFWSIYGELVNAWRVECLR